ncbi:MAG: hypothetical protein REH79_02965 [Spiroplasma sp.]|nr:hypothetical protein [Spiroplasma sp.]
MKTIKQQKKYFSLLKNSVKDWRFWIKSLIGLTQISSVVIFLTVSVIFEHNWYIIPEHLSYFTTLSNLFCGIFFIYSAIFHYAEGNSKFDNSEVAKIVITYITLTVLLYNLNQLMTVNPYFFDDWKYLMSFICEHSLVPILAIIYCLFFYNHKNSATIKEFNKKWVWYMVLGLVIYLLFFSVIGLLAKIFKWKPLFGTIDGSGDASTFVYPFMDWYHGVGFFKYLPSWFECIVMLTATFIVAIGFDYFYTFIIIKVNAINQKILLGNQYKKNNVAIK